MGWIRFRKILFWIHLTVGVTLGLFIAMMAATGLILSFEPQLVEWSERQVRVVRVPADLRPLPLGEILHKAAEQKDQVRPSAVLIQSDRSASVMVSFGREGGVYIDPYTGAVLGGSSVLHGFMHTVEDIHRFLALEGPHKAKGRAVTGAASLSFLFLIFSGVCLWWPRKWTAQGIRSAVFFDWKLKDRARDWNQHNVLGIWFAPLALVAAGTGVIMAYPWANDLLYRAAGDAPPPRQQSRENVGEPKGGPKYIFPSDRAQTLIESTKERIPSWTTIQFRFPKSEDAPAVMVVQERGRPPFMRTQLTLDAMSAAEIKREPFDAQSRGRRWRAWARYLHTGEAFGAVTQAAAAGAAAATIWLVWTGLALAWRRFFTRPPRLSQNPENREMGR